MDDTCLKNTLQNLGASADVVDSFIANGYSEVNDLKSITGYELKAVIPQVLIRKKFSQKLIPWLIVHNQKIDEEIALFAGIHPSQTTTSVIPGNETYSISSVKNSDGGSTSDYSDSIQSVGCDKPTSSSISKSGTISETTDEDQIDVSNFDGGVDDFDLQLRKEQDLAKAENFVLPKDKKDIQEKSDASSIDRQKNPIWVLLKKGTLESKRIAHLPEETILNTSEIKEIAQIVGEYLFSEASTPKRQVTPYTCNHWATQYFQPLFPNTGVHRFYFIKREVYTNKSGKKSTKSRPTGALYTQLCLLRKKLLIKDDAAKIRISSSNKDKDSVPEPVTPQKITRQSHRYLTDSDVKEDDKEYSPPGHDDETIDLKLSTLRVEVPSHASADLLESWNDTHAYRMTELKETQGSVWDYIKLYKGLSNPAIGPILIKKDFETLIGASNTNSKLQDFLLLKKANIIDVAKGVLSKLAAELQKDLISSFLQLTEEDDVTLQCSGLLLLLPFLFPGVYQVNKHWKPTKSNVLNAFISKVDTEADVQESIDKLRSHLAEVQSKLKWKAKLHLQPYVLAVGPSWLEIVQAHIVLDKVIYTLPNVPEAVELCFQIFHSFHAEYPLECHNVWEFIQQAVYGIYTEFDWNHRSTSELAEQLGISLKRQTLTKIIAQKK